MTPSHKTFRKSGLIIAAITGLTVSACASAPNQKGGPDESRSAKQAGTQQDGKRRARRSGTFVKPIGLLFTSMDSNRNSLVSRSELNAGIASEWRSFSTNPGAIAYNQWSLENLGSADAQPTFMSFDKNFDGNLSQEEFSNHLEQSFLRMDSNNDGQLERSEMIVAFQAQQGQARGQRGGERSGQGGGRGEGGGGRGGRGGGR